MAGPGSAHGPSLGEVRFFYDCEFIEDGTTIDLVSIGVAAEDGREFYAVSTEFDADRAGAWVRSHVLPQLPAPGDAAWLSRAELRASLLEFLTAANRDVELWAWIGAYDHVALCQLWGTMPTLPRALPRFTRELRQHWEDAGKPALPPPPANAHDALADARHNLVRWRAIQAHLANGGHAVGRIRPS